MSIKEDVKLFIGEVENLHNIDINKVGENKYRVNVWDQTTATDSVCQSFSIIDSYYIKYEDGDITDLTIVASGSPTNGIFA